MPIKQVSNALFKVKVAASRYFDVTSGFQRRNAFSGVANPIPSFRVISESLPIVTHWFFAAVSVNIDLRPLTQTESSTRCGQILRVLQKNVLGRPGKTHLAL